MPEFLVVRLQSAAAETIGAAAEWIVVDGTGARRSNVQSGPLDLAVATAASRKVIVLVPGTDALLAEPVLPVKSGTKLAQVVPFALLGSFLAFIAGPSLPYCAHCPGPQSGDGGREGGRAR